MLNDARVASLEFFKDNVCTTKIHKENKFKIKFQVLLKFAQVLPDYIATVSLSFKYQVRIMTMASTVFKKSTFQKKSHLNALGSKFDLDVKWVKVNLGLSFEQT